MLRTSSMDPGQTEASQNLCLRPFQNLDFSGKIQIFQIFQISHQKHGVLLGFCEIRIQIFFNKIQIGADSLVFQGIGNNLDFY